MPIKPLNSRLVDGESNDIALQCAYAVRDDFLDVIDEIAQQHGPSFYLLPLSGMSAGGGVFQVPGPSDGPVIGLAMAPVAQPVVRRGKVADCTQVALDEIVIDEDRQRIYAGASITLDQLSHALIEEIGPAFRVAGADLTSYAYAQVGATFMTGGMGPMRRYFSDSVVEIALFDGTRVTRVAGNQLPRYAGTYGWSGVVTAVCCRYHEFPASEIGFVLPMDCSGTQLSGLMERLATFAFLDTNGHRVTDANGGHDLIIGVEHLSLESAQPMLDEGTDSQIVRRTRKLIDHAVDAGADSLLFVHGLTDSPVDAYISRLVDNPDAESLTLSGVDLDRTEFFEDPVEMREIREGIPAAARSQIPTGAFISKDHTDVNVRLNPANVGPSMTALWSANQDYVRSVAALFSASRDVSGQVLVYGHVNPYGVDPHNRVTYACDDPEVHRETSAELLKLRNSFVRALRTVCDNTGSLFVGGEKGAGTEMEIFDAFGGAEGAPVSLYERFKSQAEAIRAASPMFNWRAMPPYLQSN